MRRIRLLCLLSALAFCLCGCGGGQTAEAAPAAEEEVLEERAPENGSAADDPAESEDFEPYEAPAFRDAVFHEDAAEGEEDARVDLSAVGEGYVAVSARSDARLKFQVMKDDVTYNYDLASDGTPSIFPLQSGNGTYRFRVMENVSESKYAEKFSTECEVTLEDEFQPFLRPNDYVNYSESSQCVKKARELAQKAPDALGVMSQVYDWVCDNVTYDSDLAATVQSGYLPEPDGTLNSGKGICFDYASLAASMLRSQGIPTKVIFGYVSPDDLYHAWNMVYTEESGWVTVSFEVSGDEWNRVDLTFAANGADADFIGDGSNYADLYYY